MIRALIDSGNAPPQTGIGVYSNELVSAIKTYLPSQIEVAASSLSLPGIFPRPVKRLIYLYRLNQIAKHGFRDSDVVHFTNVYVPKRTRSAGFISTIHDIDAILFPETYPLLYRHYFRKAVERAFERSHLVLTVSNAARNSILERFRIEGTSIRVISNGLSEAFTRAAAGVESSYKGEIPILLFVGSLSKKKNTAWLIRTVREGLKAKQLPAVKLILAGSAGYCFNAVELEMKIAGSIVEWVPHCSLSRLIRLYKSCDVVVLPSRTEGFGIPLLEAMHCDKPIVASDIPAFREIAEGVAAFFDLDNPESFFDAVKRAVADKETETRRKNAERKLERYRWSELVYEYLDAYNSVAEKKRSH